MKDSRTREELDLCKRVGTLVYELRARNDFQRLADICKVLDAGTKQALKSKSDYGHVLYSGCAAVLNYLEEKYPDLYGYIQTVRKDLNK